MQRLEKEADERLLGEREEILRNEKYLKQKDIKRKGNIET